MIDDLINRLKYRMIGHDPLIGESIHIMQQMQVLLHDASDLLDNYADVIDGYDGQPEANDAMILKQEIDRLLENSHD